VSRLGYAVTTRIDRPVPEVFDFLSDIRNELAWNPDAKSVEKLTDGPIGVGTRFRALWARTGSVEVEMVGFDPPRAWATRSAAMGMDVTATGRLEEVGDATRRDTPPRSSCIRMASQGSSRPWSCG
jgi:hypothetical protein